MEKCKYANCDNTRSNLRCIDGKLIEKRIGVGDTTTATTMTITTEKKYPT